MAFHEVRFPLAIGFGASGGPERRTEIVTLGSGHEERNSPWALSRRRWNAGLGLRALDDIHALIEFSRRVTDGCTVSAGTTASTARVARRARIWPQPTSCWAWATARG